MKNVITEIAVWAAELTYWEQVALDKILNGVEFTDGNYEELLQYLLEDAKLVEGKSKRKMLAFQQLLTQTDEELPPVVLQQINNLQHVNALVPDQTLTFGQQLTAIFGKNGSGKSGYARMLGCAGFTRGDKDVLPDVTKPVDDKNKLTADILISDGKTERKIHYQAGRRCPELGSFYVFDSTSVNVHMCGKNTFSFSPAGLSVLKTLADVTDEVRNRLGTQIREKSTPVDFERYFSGESKIKDLIRHLSPETDIFHLKELSRLTTAEEKRIHELNHEISSIALEKTHEEMEKLEEQIQQLSQLHDCLVSTLQRLSDTSIHEINQAIADYHKQLENAQKFSADQFHHSGLTQTGTDAWNEFILAAKNLAEAEKTADRSYPQLGEPCLLCHQPLSKAAEALLLNLWSYLEGEAQDKLSKTEQLLDGKKQSLYSSSGIDISQDLTNQYKIITTFEESLSHETQKLVEALNDRRNKVAKLIENKQRITSLPNLPEVELGDISRIVETAESRLGELKRQNLQEEIQKREDEKRILEHRKQLAELLPQIETHINNLLWAREAGKAGGSTYHITRKHNQLFDELVKKRYMTLFKRTLEDLGRPLKVKIITTGRKGETLKQIILEADKSATSIAEPEKVLSEGEKRAVALADFLTEVALDTSSSGIILDDPVTSLDLEWRETIARILTREANNRQVIIFTHDMPFLYLLLKSADELGLNREVHWIKRGDVDDRPGYVYVNNCPALESEYKSPGRAEERYKNALDASPELQEAILKDGFGALRTTYEALIVFELLNGVVLRFDERISFGRLSQIAWDPGLVQEIIQGCERLSRYIEGHLHSDAMASITKLSPELLRKEIDLYVDLRKRLRALKNRV